MVAILIAAYLVVGALASGLIWLILIASKRPEKKANNMKRGRLESALFRGANKKPSRFRP
jgi:hypothetical protein